MVGHRYLDQKNWVTAIWRSNKTGSQLFGSRTNWAIAIWNLKILGHSYLEPEGSGSHLFRARKLRHSFGEPENNVSQLFS